MGVLRNGGGLGTSESYNEFFCFSAFLFVGKKFVSHRFILSVSAKNNRFSFTECLILVFCGKAQTLKILKRSRLHLSLVGDVFFTVTPKKGLEPSNNASRLCNFFFKAIGSRNFYKTGYTYGYLLPKYRILL